MGNDRKKCPGGKCEKCYMYRYFTYEDDKTKEVKHFWECAIDHILIALPQIYGSIDGVQKAANQARNRSMETKARVESFGEAMCQIVDRMERKLIK